MSREAFEKWYAREFKRLPNNDWHETYIAWEAWQAVLQHSGEPVAWHISKDPDGDQSSHVTADGEFASSYAQMGWKVSPLYTAPQPVVDVNQKLVEALQAVLDCGSTSDQWWIDKAREALLSAGKGGE